MSPSTETLASLSFQRFYRFFHRLSSMTGPARDASDELWAIYHIPVITVPENRPCQRVAYPTRAFADTDEKFHAIVEETLAVHASGRPVLVGTRNVKNSEELSARLTRSGLRHMVLNAIRHREEAGIISLAGMREAVTTATKRRRSVLRMDTWLEKSLSFAHREIT